MAMQTLEVFKPYLVRAVYEWCLDNSNTPYIAVRVDSAALPPEIADENGIAALNIGPVAVRDLKIGSAHLSFTARFRGKVCDVTLDYGDVLAVFGKESGHRLVLSAELVRAAGDGKPGNRHVPARGSSSDADKPRKKGRLDIKAY